MLLSTRHTTRSEMSDAILNLSDNGRALFQQWLSARHVKKTCEKYEQCINAINFRSIKTENCSLFALLTPRQAAFIIRALEAKALLVNKEERKSCVLFLSFLAQTYDFPEKESENQSVQGSLSKADFERWLITFNGFSYAQSKKYIEDLDKISKKAYKSTGLSIYEVFAVPDLQKLHFLLNAQLDKSQKRVLDYFFAYLCYCLPDVDKSVEEVIEPAIRQHRYFDEWCFEQGLTRGTVDSMKEFVESLSKYAAYRDLSQSFEECNPSDKLRTIFLILSQAESYLHLLSEFKHHGYIDRYCQYLLSVIPEKKVRELIREKTTPAKLPVLITGNEKQIGKLFAQWLKENKICSDGSARTFVSSLYDCEEIALKEFNSTLFDIENKFRVAWLRLQIIESPNFISRLFRPLWLYLQFLASYHVVSVAQYDADKQRLLNLLNKKYNGCLGVVKEGFNVPLFFDWLNEYGDVLPYSKEQIIGILNDTAVYDSNKECYYTLDIVISEESKNRVREYISEAWNSGSPIVDYSQIIKSLPEHLEGISVDILRRYLALSSSGEYICEAKYLRALKVPKQNRGDIGAYVCQLLRNVGKPVSRKELFELAPALSEKSIQVVLGGNNNGVNIGIINPKGAKNKIFHADIVNLTKKEQASIIGLINGELLSNEYVTASRLYSLVKEGLPDLFKRYNFLTRTAVYGVLRYKFGKFFTFNISCVTYNERINVSSIFLSFCKSHRKFKLSDLSKIEADLGVVGIPFEQIYTISARISQDSFISREGIKFDVASIDRKLSAYCPKKITPIRLFERYDKLPRVQNMEWNIFLLEHYLLYHSKKLCLLKRNLAKGGCYGFIVRKRQEIQDFDSVIVEYLATKKIEYTRENVLSLLFEEGIIAARRYESIDSIIARLNS